LSWMWQKQSEEELDKMNEINRHLLSGDGDYAGAEPLLKDLLKYQEEKYGKDSPQLMMTLDNLGMALARQGKGEEAEKVLRRSLEIAEKTLPECKFKDMQLGLTLGLLAESLSAQGKYDEAEKAQEKSLKHVEKAYGNKDSQYGYELQHLADIQTKAGKF